MELPILFEDSDYVVIDKPSGLVVHSDGKTKEPAITDWVLEHYPETKNVGEPTRLSTDELIARPGIVHRIDRETTGTLVIAKNVKAFFALKSQFQNREVNKTYHAFIYGTINLPDGGDEGVIDRPIGRSSKDFRLWSAQRGARGEMREAVTKYKILQANKEYSFVEVYPKTGRTHQIRVHFKAIHHPVICDSLYAPKRECALGFTRLALHASEIEFKNTKGDTVKVESPFPSDFKKAIDLLKKDMDA